MRDHEGDNKNTYNYNNNNNYPNTYNNNNDRIILCGGNKTNINQKHSNEIW